MMDVQEWSKHIIYSLHMFSTVLHFLSISQDSSGSLVNYCCQLELQEFISFSAYLFLVSSIKASLGKLRSLLQFGCSRRSFAKLPVFFSSLKLLPEGILYC